MSLAAVENAPNALANAPSSMQQAIEITLAAWRGHKSYAWAGECGIFADYAGTLAQSAGMDVTFDSFDSALNSQSSVLAPPGIGLHELGALGVWEGLNHVWLVHDGRHYDAAHPEGVANPRDLASFRLAMVYMLRQYHPQVLARLAARHDWWRESERMACEFDAIERARLADYQEN